MQFRPFSFGRRSLFTGFAMLLGAVSVLGQTSSSTPSAPTPHDPSPSRWDVFMGYSYVAPHGTVSTPEPGGVNTDLNYSAITYGAIGSVAYYFNRYAGAQVEYANHPNGNNDGAQTAQAGLIFRYPQEGMTWFAHGLAGGVRLGGPNVSTPPNPPPGPGFQPKHIYTWGPALTVGGGLDYDLPFFDHRFALRLFQADYEYWHANFGPAEMIGGRANVNAARLSAGIVMHFGSIVPPPPVQYACVVTPSSVFPGNRSPSPARRPISILRKTPATPGAARVLPWAVPVPLPPSTPAASSLVPIPLQDT